MARGSPTPHSSADLGKPIEYDPDFQGPLKRRSCTDVICLFMFIVFLGCWVGVGMYAYLNGDPETLVAPRDSSGSRCGIDDHVKDKKYLHFFDLTQCLKPNVAFTGCNTPQVCVEDCPRDFFLLSAPDSKIDNIICIDGQEKPKTREVAEELVKQKKCTNWILPSRKALKRCLPDLTHSSIDQYIKQLGNDISRESLIQANKNIEFLEKSKQVGQDIADDLKNSWKVIVVGLLIAILVCIIYIGVMRWIAPVMVWLSILGVVALLGVCIYYCYEYYKYYVDHPYEQENAKAPFEKYVRTKEFWMVILIIVGVLEAILVLVLIFLRKRIVLAIALIKEGSKAVSAVTSSLFFPVIPWLLQMAIIVYAVSIAIYLSSVGTPRYEIRDLNGNCQCDGDAKDYKDGVVCKIDLFTKLCGSCLGNSSAQCKFIKMDNPPMIPYAHAFNVFGFFWAVFFISAMGEMILAATFATWYWTFHKSNVPFFTLTAAAGRTLRYHIGTLAFGSLIIAICRMIRVALEYIDHKLKKYDNPVTKAILCCLKCFFWCLEKFLKFINKNAYIMCAIHGKNFCASAKDAFSLLLRNIVRVFVLDKVTDFLFFLSKLLVSLGVACIIYSFVEYVTMDKLNYSYIPAIFIGICTYFIASMFFSVYTMAVDTLFLCFLEDCERNNGSAEKPYFMSKNLMKILGKKNKMS